MRTFRFAAVSAAMVLASAPAWGADPAAARDHLKKGYELAQANKCDEAIPHLAESLRLDPKAITLINLAQCEEKVGKLSDALGHWVDARARAQSENNADIQIEAEKRAKALEARLPHLTIVLAPNAPQGTEVSRDGTVLGAVSLGQPTSVNPGAHVIVVKAPGRKDRRTEITLGEAETKTVNVDVGDVDASATPATAKPAAPPASDAAGPGGGTSPLVYVGFGTAAVGLTVGAITGLVALGAASKAKDACPNTACPSQDKLDDVESGRTMGTISTVGFAVMGVGLAVGVYGLLSSGKSAPTKTGIAWGPTGVRGSF